MSKPSWDDAPEWAQYLAMDSDNYWYWYELRPQMTPYCWHHEFRGRCECAVEPPDWEDSLEERPCE